MTKIKVNDKNQNTCINLIRINQDNLNMYKRSMGGRIYHEKTFRPQSISMNNPEQRSLQYPIKGDTLFDPEEYGKKHYLSPKHSAIHSIIFNEDYDTLMKQKRDIIDKINTNRNAYRFDERADKQKIQGLNNYLNQHIIQQNRLNSHSNPFPPYNNFQSQQVFQSRDKITKGHLFRQGSMNEVLKPYSGNERENLMERNRSMLEVGSRNLQNQGNQRKNPIDSISLSILPKSEFPRFINPNNLNSNF